ncbi:MAG: hypothetical protein JO146_06760 [Candidatus Eremiobacteraeota bacterium]|nr:hypothetical protein [Candidatus Eremiobacteraeota bacterium]
MKSIASLIALFAFSVLPALAQSSPAPAPSTTPIASPSPAASPKPVSVDVHFTARDLAALLKATQDAQTSSNVTININSKEAWDMPVYDPIVHFAGVDASSGAATIWILKSPPKTKDAADSLLAALELACMATGFAGPQWKSIYDSLAAADAALPAGAPNPYVYRLTLTRRIQTIIDKYKTQH